MSQVDNLLRFVVQPSNLIYAEFFYLEANHLVWYLTKFTSRLIYTDGVRVVALKLFRHWWSYLREPCCEAICSILWRTKLSFVASHSDLRWYLAYCLMEWQTSVLLCLIQSLYLLTAFNKSLHGSLTNSSNNHLWKVLNSVSQSLMTSLINFSNWFLCLSKGCLPSKFNSTSHWTETICIVHL